jgi:signal peptidase II
MQKSLRLRAGGWAACIALGVILTDRVTKLVIARTLDLHESVSVVKGFFALTHLRNPSGIFGLGPAKPLFFTIASFMALLFLVYLFRTLDPQRRGQHVAFGLIMGGAVGNLIDRTFCGEQLFRGPVTDFLDFSIRGHHWPPFNIADSAITVGVGLFLLSVFLASKEEAADASSDS